MSLTSYQAAPPRAMRILWTSTFCKSKNRFTEPNAFVFRLIATSLRCERENSCGHSELVGPGFCGALVSEETASRRPIALVCPAFRFGRSELDILFGSGAENGGALVRC